MTINVDKATKLLGKLAAIDAKIGALQEERSNITDEINGMISGGSAPTPAQKSSFESVINTAKAAKKAGQTLGDKVVAYFQSKPGSTLQAAAKALDTTPSKVGLAVHHLKNKNKVWMDNGLWYATGSMMTAAAKASTTDAEEGDF